MVSLLAEGDVAVVETVQPRWRSAEGVLRAQQPHERYRPPDAFPAPLARRAPDSGPQAHHRPQSLHTTRELDVLHQRDVRVSPYRVERLAPDEDRLIAREDPGEPGRHVSEPSQGYGHRVVS